MIFLDVSDVNVMMKNPKTDAELLLFSDPPHSTSPHLSHG